MSDVASRGADIAATTTAAVYVSDENSVGVIRQAFNDLGLTNAKFTLGNIRTATTEMARQSSPRLLIVDISDIDDPGSRIGELAQVCEPETAVIVIGEANDIRLYRELRTAGVSEYFYKPLVRNVMTHACNVVLSGAEKSPGPRGGRLVFVLGVRGGVGATTIAVSTAWHLAEQHKRWTMLLDLDLSAGDAALQFDATPGRALAESFERPERVDQLFLERGVVHIAPRLDLLASLEPLESMVAVQETAMLSLVDMLLRRYRFLFIDVPAISARKLSQVLHLPSLCVLVSNGSLTSARDVARWRQQIGPNTPERSTIHVLNRSGSAGSLPEAEFVRAVGKPPDIVIPYDREIGAASLLGIKGLKNCAVLKSALAPLVSQLTGDVAAPTRSFLSRLFG